MYVAVGRIRLAPGTKRVRILWYGAFAYLQSRRAHGNLYASARREDFRTLWSLSVWESPAAMLAYRDSGAHLRVMRIAQDLNAPADFVQWESESVPTWPEAMAHLRAKFG